MIGKIIKEQMDFFNLNQSDLILRTGIDQKCISDLLNNKRKITSDLSYKIGKVFELESHWLYDYQEKKDRLLKKKNDKDLVEISTCVGKIFNKCENMAEESLLELVSRNINAATFYDYKNFANKRLIGFKKYKEKNMAYFWIALMDKKYGSMKATGSFMKYKGNKIINEIISIMLGNETVDEKIKISKKLLDKEGVLLNNGPFIKDSTIYGVTLLKNKQRHIFLSDMNKRFCRYIFSLIHELIHIYGESNLSENEIDFLAIQKIKNVITKEHINDDDMNVLIKAYETSDWESIYTNARTNIFFGQVDDLL